MTDTPQEQGCKDAAPNIYHNLIRMMVYLHRGFNPAKAWPNLPKEPSFPQFRTLMILRHLGPCPLKCLADALGISAAAASEMVERLVDLELVDRRQDPLDRRRVQIGLTRSAIKGVARHEAFILERLTTLMDEIGPQHSCNMSHLFGEIGGFLNTLTDPKTHPQSECLPNDNS
jgi:DNA-binding MarR family transcriptional regulator